MIRGFILLPLFLSACANGHPQDYLRMRDIPAPTLQSFTHCYSYGCEKRANVGLPKDTQNKLNNLFKIKPQSAEEERKNISLAIQIFEQDIGEIVGTKNDKYGTFRLYQDSDPKTRRFQQDCIDESTNTTIYLTLLQDLGYLKFHHPAFPANRQPILNRVNWWHQTAVIEEIATGQKYAVDSWFEDNGYPAHIVPLTEWKKGWKPKKNGAE